MTPSNDLHISDASDTAEPDQQARAWFTRLRADDCSVEELEAFESWQRIPQNRLAYQRTQQLWAILQAPALEVVKANRKRLSRHKRAPWAVAASLLVAVATMLAFVAPPLATWGSDYATAAGVQQHISLSDGSTMTLDSGSAVDIDFNTDRRVVRLREGRVFLDVVHDGRPLLVEAGASRVRVLGTAFSVEHRAGHEQVVLLRGSVEVENAGQRRLISPEQSLTVLNNRFAPLESVNAARELAWRDGQLLVRQKPLRQVLDELMRHSGGHVVWLNDVRANTLVSGSFNLAESESAVNALLTSQGVRATFVTSKLLILR